MARRETRAREPRSRSGESGQALLELALIAPVMIILLVSIVQLGLIFQRQIGIQNAVREAARRGATQATFDAAVAATNATWTLGELQTLLGNIQGHTVAQERDLQVCYYTPAPPYDVDASGETQVMVSVQAAYAHPVFLPIISIILDGIDSVQDEALRADYSVEFHVEDQDDTIIPNLGGVTACATP